MGKSALWLLLFVILASLFVLPLPVKAEPETITVPDDYPSIQQAIDAARTGDTVFVKAGNYTGTIEVNKSIALKGEENKTVISDWTPITGHAAILVTHNNVTVSGMTIDNPTYTTMWTKKRGIHILGASDCIITHNTVRHCDSGQAQGIWLYQAQNNYIADNTVENSNIGIDVESSMNNQIVNNTLRNNEIGIYVKQSSQNSVTQNTVVDGAIGLQLMESHNNTFTSNDISCPSGVRFAVRYDVYSTYDEGNVFTHNNFYQPTLYPYVHLGSEIIGATYYETDYTVTGTNYFDDGAEGNYYARYGGKDLNRDGIGDTSYGLSTAGNFTDYHPLMAPWAGDKKAPIIEVYSPKQNEVIATTELMLNFTVNEATSELKYSFDGQGNVTLSGNATLSLSDLSNGNHNLIVYATDLAGNEASSKMVDFMLAVPFLYWFPTLWVALVSVLSIVVIVAAVMLFRRRRFVKKP